MFTVCGPALWRGKTAVLGAFSFALAPGEMLGVVGPNGSGKSTLLRAMAGLGAQRVAVARDGRALGRRQIGYLPQGFGVGAALSVLDCVLLGRREALGLRVPMALIDEAHALLGRHGLSGLADRAMSALSGGQQQRVLIVQRLFRAPQLMLMDEPTSALDLHHQLAALAELRGYARRADAAVVVALHDLTLAARYCDRVMLVAGARCGTPDAPEAVLTRDVLRRHWRIEPEFMPCRQGRMVIIPHTLPPEAAHHPEATPTHNPLAPAPNTR